MKSTLDENELVIQDKYSKASYEPGCGVIDSCRVTHCLCRICTVAPWCGEDCKECEANNFGERKIKCVDFCPDKYMINYMRQLDEQDEMITGDRISMKILKNTMEGE